MAGISRMEVEYKEDDSVVLLEDDADIAVTDVHETL
jgi:hypothetical protein